ncbi:MAG: hypothetical protein H7Z19_15850, partial [Chitinophagaceae bacterium]|nr:hypothetical protein [Rubrivivax sp.]
PPRKLTTALLAATVLAACGGSSGSADGGLPALPPPPAQAACDDQAASRVPARVDEQIGIDTAANLGPAAPLIGFIHGIAAPSGPDADFHAEAAARITALKPALWRVSDARHHAKAKALGAQQIMYSSADELFGYQPVYYPWNDSGTRSGSFDNWARFDANAANLLQRGLAPGQGVDYWVVLNEPPVSHYTDAERQQLLETYRHGWHNFKNGRPEQNVVGPTSLGFNALLIQSFLDYAAAQNLKYDAIDWHEIGTRPEDVVAHASEVRAMLAARPGLGTPAITISE